VSPLFSQLPLQLLLIIVGVLFFVAGYVIAVGLFVVNVPTLGLVLLLLPTAFVIIGISIVMPLVRWRRNPFNQRLARVFVLRWRMG
jgi:hypothetical protein